MAHLEGIAPETSALGLPPSRHANSLCGHAPPGARLLASPPISVEPLPHTRTPDEAGAGWILLFDGETVFGWASRGPAQWEAAEGVVRHKAGTAGGFLSTTTESADFQLRADFWVSEDTNSGVFLRCPPAGDVTSANACEVNIFDPHEKWPTGSINEVARARETNKTVGQWNTMTSRRRVFTWS